MESRNNPRRVLFIAWDAPHVNYLEGLFLPIFNSVSNRSDVSFHILHFSWNIGEKEERLKAICRQWSIQYTYVPVSTSLPVVGKYLSLLRGVSQIRKYITANKIDIVMPRSTMPAKMVLSAIRGFDKIKMVFDADGLPIEERVDFAGLKEKSVRYNMLKKIEKEAVTKADRVLTRSRKAIEVLTKQHNIAETSKFFVVMNGRDETIFYPHGYQNRLDVREREMIPADALLMIYTGSLGPQYGLAEMFQIQRKLAAYKPVYLLMLVTNPEYVDTSGIDVPRNTIIRKVPFASVPAYLAAADVGLAIRQATFSMKGVFPIKLGEYLLSGLPVVASQGIGDTEDYLSQKSYAHIMTGYDENAINGAVEWIRELPAITSAEESNVAGISFFSLSVATVSYITALEGL